MAMARVSESTCSGSTGFEQIYQELRPARGQAKVLVLDSDTKFGHWLSGLLTDDELAQCHKYRKSVDRQTSAAMRGLWKLGAGALTNAHPSLIHCQRTPFGRPILLGADGGEFSSLFDLNVSRTGSWCGIVLSGAGSCGIDIETIDPKVITSELIETLGPECEQGGSYSGRCFENPKSFFERWTQIEAVLKADGRGLSDGLQIANRQMADIKSHECWAIGSKTWIVRPIQTPSHVVGTCAFGDKCCSLIEIDASRLEEWCGSAFSARVNTD